MKRLIVSSVLFGFLGLGLAVGHAQHAPSGAGHNADHARMVQMMKMMGEMQEQMKGMQEQTQGSGPVHGRMEQMMGEMARMRAMMEQHHEMMQQCPGAGAAAAPSK
jgi:hypothetical protein